MTTRPTTKRVRRPIGFTWTEITVAGTGEVVLCLVPTTRWDRAMCADRRWKPGAELMADPVKARNVGLWRLAHRLGTFLVEHVEGFELLDAHRALKKLQTDSGIGVIEEEFDLGELGKVRRRVAESLNFSDMEDTDFRRLWCGTDGRGGWIGWLRREKWGQLDPVKADNVERLITGEDPMFAAIALERAA